MRTTLMGTPNDAHCFDCKNPFTDNYLVNNLGRNWLTTIYKVHRREMLYQREGIAKLPDSMNAALVIINIRKEEDLVRDARAKINELRRDIRELEHKMSASYVNIRGYRNGGTLSETKAIFTMPCPADDCRGYLSTAYKCGSCDLYTCPKCFELVGHTRNDETHVCKEENIQSAELVRKETKPCPSCGTRIYKIEGCDQMFCTHCKKPWSWNTGKLDLSGRLHNPHYYEWLRRNGGVPRNPDDVQCDREFTPHLVTKIRLRIEKNHPDLFPIFVKCENVVRTMIHLEHHIPRPQDYEHRNEMMRFDYLMNKISETKMKIQLELNERNNNKKQEFYDIFLLIKTAITDIMLRISHNLQEKTSNNTHEILYEIDPLLKYANECLDEVSYTYSCTKMKYVFSEEGILYTKI